LTSTLCGLLTLIAAPAVYAAFHPLRDQKPNKESGESGWDKLIVWSPKVDHDIVDNWFYVTGTHYPSRRATAQHRLAPRRSALSIGSARPWSYLGSDMFRRLRLEWAGE